MTGDASPSLEELLRDPGWVRALARRLVADDVLADDLAQETWLAFLRRPPRSPQALRSWTVSVVRKLAARFRRGEKSRARRELAAARPEASEASPEAALLRVELLEEVLRAVLDLDEPFRSTVLLRFFEELSTGEIARRQGVSETTVRWRLRSALETLRRRLEAARGGEGRRAAMAMGGALVTSKLAGIGSVAAALVIAIALGWLALRPPERGAGGAGGLVVTGRPPGDPMTAIAEGDVAASGLPGVSTGLEGPPATMRGGAGPLGTAMSGLRARGGGVLVSLGPGIDFALEVERLWRSSNARGDLEAMARCVDQVDELFPTLLARGDLTPAQRASSEHTLFYNGFRRGHVDFAKGELARAAEDFDRHIADLDGEERRLAALGLPLPPAMRVYRMRSRDCLGFVRSLGGRLAPLELDLGAGWVTERRPRAASREGRALGIVFRMVDDGRSGAFLGPLGRWAAVRDGVDVATISFMRGEGTLEADAAELRADLRGIGFEGPAGVDPDAAGKRVFRAYRAAIGSATFIVLDRRGRVVWFLQDPRGEDVELAQGVLARAASS